MIAKTLCAAMLLLFSAAAFPSPTSTTVTFSDGNEGWEGSQGSLPEFGGSFIDTSFGRDAPALRTVFNNFGITYGTNSNQAFLGDYTAFKSISLGLDVFTSSLNFYGMDVTRELVVELRDYHSHPDDVPYASVWYSLGILDPSKQDWQHFSVTINDTASGLLPSGWGGYGAFDEYGGPKLPEGRTFSSVLANVDELVFTTLVPGSFYAYANHDVTIDNISISTISAVPEPGSVLMFGAGLVVLGLCARRQRRDAAVPIAA